MSSSHTPTLAPLTLVGAGPVGLACALLLHARGVAVRVLDARAPEDSAADARVLALSRGSWALLQPFLQGSALQRADITDVKVSSSGEFGLTHLPSPRSDKNEPLGATVRYGELVMALARATAQADIDLQTRCAVTHIEQESAQVRLKLSDGRVLSAPIAVLAEGFAKQKTPRAHDHAQNHLQSHIQDWAIVASVQASGVVSGTAFERFTREGPLALLPEPGRTNAPKSTAKNVLPMSLVWCMSEAECNRRAALSDSVFLAELQSAVGVRVAKLEQVGPRQRFPLTQTFESQPWRHRVVQIGNAAQTLHPVAGQGFNLGLRDAAVLAQALTHRPEVLSTDAALQHALATYSQRRVMDRRVIASVTAALPAVFATRFTPLALARSLGLVALDVVPALRNQLAHLLMFGVRASG